ncbi:hypothetical protein U8527_03075 [Kordia algicida OT-1]|uniref:Uncharacterized protein n=1 Tax=Kordia algicida OT-1 TaxID=391587 RepID=A9DNW7_9FLAO|nr:hypothetical protein [Kordia algicida]EDP97298.1 hypothetical protein KAOT1_19087 [Kordia algicida OT-1]
MIEIFMVIIETLILIVALLFTILIYKVYTKMKKIHTIISINSIELERMKELAIGKDDLLSKIEQKINGMHTVISTQLVKGIMKSSKEK